MQSSSEPNTPPIISQISRNRFLDIDGIKTAQGDSRETRAYGFDQDGRLVKTTFYRNESLESATEQSYDRLGRLESKTVTIQGVQQPKIAWEYKRNGLLQAVTYPSGMRIAYSYSPGTANLSDISWTDPGGTSGNIASFDSYDDAGRFGGLSLSSTQGDPLKLLRKIDKTGREYTRIISGLSGPDTERIEEFVYDEMGRISSIEHTTPSANTFWNYSYSLQDYLTQELFKKSDNAAPSYDLRYKYNASVGSMALQTQMASVRSMTL